MTDTLTPNKGLTLQGIGGNNNTWGDVLNDSLTLVDLSLGGTITITISGDDTVSSDDAQNTGFIINGTLTANAILTFPAFYGFANIYNNTSGGFNISVGITGFVVVPTGEFATIWSDGTDFRRLTAGFTGFTHTMTGIPSDTGDNASDFNSQVSPGSGSTKAALSVFPRGQWRFSGTVTSDDLTTWMMLPGTKLGYYSKTGTGDTHATTTVNNISLNANTEGWQVGMSIASSNNDIPANTTIAAISGGGHSITLSRAATGSNVGGTLSVYGGSLSAMPSLQWYQFSQRGVGVGFARSMSLAGTAIGGLDGRGSGTADQSALLVSGTTQISNSQTSYNKRVVFVQTDQFDQSPNTADGSNANPYRNSIGLWSGITSRVTPGLNGYAYTTHGRVTGIYSKATLVRNGSAYMQGVQVEINNNSLLAVQQYPYSTGGTGFSLLGSSVIGSGGTGYVVNDVLTLTGGTFTTAAQVKVLSVSSGVVLTFSVQVAGSYSVLPANDVASTGGTGTGFTLTAAWQGSQASNHGIVISSSGNTQPTSAIAVLANTSKFYDGIMFDAAAVQNNVFSVVDTPGSSQNVLASIDNAGSVRASGLICSNSGTTVSKIRTKNTQTGDAVFLSDTPDRVWQFGVKSSTSEFKIANAEGTGWSGTLLTLSVNGDITMPGANTFTANGSTAVSLTNVAPSGASSTVQKWFSVSDGSRKYYIPAF